MLCAAPLLLVAGGSDESAAGGDDAATGQAPERAERLPIGQYNMDEYVRQTGAEIVFSESPFLAGKGLPPIEERLPENPVVMETWMEDGKYGGTLTWTEYTIDYDHYLRHLNAVNLLEIAPSAATTATTSSAPRSSPPSWSAGNRTTRPTSSPSPSARG